MTATPDKQATVKKTSTATAGDGARANGDRNGGQAGDLAPALASALVAAVREEEQRAAHAPTSAAVSLGWHLAALGHPGHVSGTAASAGGAAVAGLTALTEGQAIEYCVNQVKVAFGKLEAMIEQSGLALPDEALRDCLARTEESARRNAATEVDAKAFAVLSAVDFRLGKGYGVGRALMDVTTRSSPETTLGDQLSEPRVAALVAAIDDLSTALPAHAAHSVWASLLEWRASVRDDVEAVRTPEIWALLARQGVLWRSVLTGEKAATEMLEIEDYVDAADRLTQRLRKVTGRFLGRFWWLVAIVLVLFGGGIALIVAGDSSAAALAGAGGVLASLGLSWRGVGTSLGQLAAKLERPLWGAEIDIAITQAITLLKRSNGRDTSESRRQVASALGRGADG